MRQMYFNFFCSNLNNHLLKQRFLWKNYTIWNKIKFSNQFFNYFNFLISSDQFKYFFRRSERRFRRTREWRWRLYRWSRSTCCKRIFRREDRLWEWRRWSRWRSFLWPPFERERRERPSGLCRVHKSHSSKTRNLESAIGWRTLSTRTSGRGWRTWSPWGRSRRSRCCWKKPSWRTCFPESNEEMNEQLFSWSVDGEMKAYEAKIVERQNVLSRGWVTSVKVLNLILMGLNREDLVIGLVENCSKKHFNFVSIVLNIQFSVCFYILHDKVWSYKILSIG